MTLDGVVQPLHVVDLINDSDSDGEKVVMTPEEVLKITDLAMQLGHIGRAHRKWLSDGGKCLALATLHKYVAFMKTTQVPLLAGKTRSQTGTNQSRDRWMDQSSGVSTHARSQHNCEKSSRHGARYPWSLPPNGCQHTRKAVELRMGSRQHEEAGIHYSSRNNWSHLLCCMTRTSMKTTRSKHLNRMISRVNPATNNRPNWTPRITKSKSDALWWMKRQPQNDQPRWQTMDCWSTVCGPCVDAQEGGWEAGAGTIGPIVPQQEEAHRKHVGASWLAAIQSHTEIHIEPNKMRQRNRTTKTLKCALIDDSCCLDQEKWKRRRRGKNGGPLTI